MQDSWQYRVADRLLAEGRLDAALAEIEGCLAAVDAGPQDDPLSRAWLLLLRARAHQQATRYAAAQPNVREAESLAAGVNDSERKRRVLVQAWQTSAELMWQCGRYEAAERTFGHAIAMAEDWFGVDDVAVAGCLNGLGIVLRYTGRNDEAEQCYLRVLAVFTARADTAGEAGILHNLAGLHFAVGDLSKAETAIRRALDLRLTQTPLPVVAIAADKLCLASILSTAGKPEAREHAQAALCTYRELFGPDHVELGYCLHVLAHIEATTGGQPAAALDMFAQALRIKKICLGPRHPELLATLISMASLHNGEAKMALLDEAWQIAEPLPPSHPLKRRCQEMAVTARTP
jgi:tetratricopeptide (TPR) repeat protein